MPPPSQDVLELQAQTEKDVEADRAEKIEKLRVTTRKRVEENRLNLASEDPAAAYFLRSPPQETENPDQ